MTGAALGPAAPPRSRRLRELLRDPRARGAERRVRRRGPARRRRRARPRRARSRRATSGPAPRPRSPTLRARARPTAACPCASSRTACSSGSARPSRRSRCSRSRAMPRARSPTRSARDGLVLVGVGARRSRQRRHPAAQRGGAGAAGIVLGAGSVDAYNPKVVRASAGAIFGVAAGGGMVGRWRRSTRCGRHGRHLPRRPRRGGARRTTRSTSPRPSAVVLGNEAHGLPADLDAALDGWITIPMRGPRSRSTSRWRAPSCASKRRGSADAADGERGDTSPSSRRCSPCADDAARGRGGRRRRRSTSSPRPSARSSGAGSPLNRANEAIKGLDPGDRPAAGKAVGAYKHGSASAVERPPRRARAARRPRPRRSTRSTSRLGGHGRRRGHLHLVTQVQRELEDIFVRPGLPRGGGPRGRGRLAQLRGAQHGARPPGPLDAGHALRRARRARAGAAAHAHVAGADPHDGDA